MTDLPREVKRPRTSIPPSGLGDLFLVHKTVSQATFRIEGISRPRIELWPWRLGTGGFLDPKARGMNLGYDQAVALPAMQADGKSGQEDIFRETNKARKWWI